MKARSLSPLMFALLLSSLCFAQTTQHDDHLLARISYQSSFLLESGRPSHICIAVYESGLYRLSAIEMVKNRDSLNPPILQGTLSKEDLDHFRGLLHNLRSNQRPENGIILQGRESFIADVASSGKSVRYTWINADHRDPFPGAIRKVIYWLLDFKPRDSTAFTLHELSDVQRPCPALNESPVQPIVAGLAPEPDALSCGSR
ncbi:MAG TPA: hypothetical protein VJO35_07300 [Terriglobales bacterium]|nr:hypothetical protein [Terriglobales bacterium]